MGAATVLPSFIYSLWQSWVLRFWLCGCGSQVSVCSKNIYLYIYKHIFESVCTVTVTLVRKKNSNQCSFSHSLYSCHKLKLHPQKYKLKQEQSNILQTFTRRPEIRRWDKVWNVQVLSKLMNLLFSFKCWSEERAAVKLLQSKHSNSHALFFLFLLNLLWYYTCI